MSRACRCVRSDKPFASADFQPMSICGAEPLMHLKGLAKYCGAWLCSQDR